MRVARCYVLSGTVLSSVGRQTVSLPSSCNKIDAGRRSRSRAHEGPLRSVQANAVAALCCCTSRVPAGQVADPLDAN